MLWDGGGQIWERRKWVRGKSNPCASTRTNNGECSQSWVLHLPWLREPLVSNLLARLKEPSPLSSRCWPWAQGVADRQVKRLLQEGKRVHELPPEVLLQKGERKPQVLPPKGGRNHDMKLQGSPNEGKREGERPDALPRKDPKVGTLAIWDLGGRPAGEGIVEAKRPIEANKNDAAGIITRKTKQEKPGRTKYQLGGTIIRNQPHTLGHTPVVPSHH